MTTAVFLTGIAAFGAAMLSTTLRSVQNKLVAAGEKAPAWVIGCGMTLLDLTVVGFVAKSEGWSPVICAGIGAGTGWVVGMVVHDHLTKDKRKAARKAEKEKQRRRVIKWTTKHQQEQAQQVQPQPQPTSKGAAEGFGLQDRTLRELLKVADPSKILINDSGYGYVVAHHRYWGNDGEWEIMNNPRLQDCRWKLDQPAFFIGEGRYIIEATNGKTARLKLYAAGAPVHPVYSFSKPNLQQEQA